MSDYIVTASNPRDTATSVINGVDVDVVFSVDGGEHVVGIVTLAPDRNGGLSANWASAADEWVSRDLLRCLDALKLGSDAYCLALDAIEAYAAEVAEA